MTALMRVDDASSVPLGSLRALVGAEVAVDTDGEHIEGTLVSCTARSAWLVCGDEDRVVALCMLRGIRLR